LILRGLASLNIVSDYSEPFNTANANYCHKKTYILNGVDFGSNSGA
jgi:hypothetical protein